MEIARERLVTKLEDQLKNGHGHKSGRLYQYGRLQYLKAYARKVKEPTVVTVQLLSLEAFL